MTLELQLPPSRSTRWRARIRHPLAVALVVAALHGANDAYAAFLHPLLPRIMAKLDLSIALAATLSMTLSIAASLAQPILGHLSDRRGRRLMILLGPTVSGVFLSLIGAAPSYPALIVVLVVGGLGSAAFHPPAVALAARVTQGRGSGMRHAVFSAGGAVGYAAGPLAAVFMVSRYGLDGLWAAMIPVMILAVGAYPLVPGEAPSESGRTPAGPGIVALLGGPVGILFGISAISAFLQRVFLTLEPIVVAAAGKTEATGAFALSLYLGAQAVGTLIGGWFTDRVNRRQLLLTLTALGFPTHFLAFWFSAGSGPSLLFALLAGAVNMAVLPPIVVMAQEMAPGRAGRNSGIVMGLAWATGSVGILGAGFLGDAIGPRAAALASTPFMLLGTLLALHRALDRYSRPPSAASA